MLGCLSSPSSQGQRQAQRGQEPRCCAAPRPCPLRTLGGGEGPAVGAGSGDGQAWIQGHTRACGGRGGAPTWGREQHRPAEGRRDKAKAQCGPLQGVGGRAGVAGGGLRCRWGLWALREEVQGRQGEGGTLWALPQGVQGLAGLGGSRRGWGRKDTSELAWASRRPAPRGGREVV